MIPKRQQLSLFIDKNNSKIIESIRQKYNPIQYALIKCHVTLCREDELIDLDRLIHNLESLRLNNLTLNFGNVIRFSLDTGVLIPVLGEQIEFLALRKQILKGIIENPRVQEAHITLMHPRNSTCTDNVFEQIKNVNFPKTLNFNKISLIEQEIDKPWHTLKEFNLI